MTATLPDRPIVSPDSDTFGRDRIARNISGLINGCPADASLRMGVYGDWGEGKTSVMMMAMHHLQQKGHYCIWLSPWIWRDRNELVAHLVREIAHVVKLGRKRILLFSGVQKLTGTARSVAEIDPRTKIAASVLCSPIEKGLRKQEVAATQKFLSGIQSSLGKNKLVVLVDDLDRLRPELVPDVLLTLREALDFPGCHYVLALDPTIVQSSLKSVNEDWGDGQEFLEKIVELPFHLPEPLCDDVVRYADMTAQTFALPKELQDYSWIRDILPRNPRKLKLLIRYLASMAEVFERFNEDEVDWRTLVVCTMLRLEFPNESRSLKEQPDVLAGLQAASLSGRMRRSAGIDDNARTPPAEALSNRMVPDPRRCKRFRELSEGIQRRDPVMVGRFAADELLYFDEHLPVVTEKEADEVLVVLAATAGAERVGELRKWAAVGPDDQVRLRALFQFVLKARERAQASAASAAIEQDVVACLNDVSALLSVLHTLALDAEGFSNGGLGYDEFADLLRQLERWAHFSTLAYYARVRREEAEFLERISAVLPVRTWAGVLENRLLNNEHPLAAQDEGWRKILSALRARAEHAVAGEVLNRLRERGGIDRYWGTSYLHEGKFLLFQARSILYRDEGHWQAFISLANAASDDAAIQENFVVLLRMIGYGAIEAPDNFSMADCQMLVRDERIMSVIWRAAVVRPLNPRTAGSIAAQQQKMRDAGFELLGMDKPDWWLRLEEIGFFAEE